ncbi:hypothetical protein [Pedobacter cryoconitis]|uniref:Uncharacterized protein n=1 Tax=Pedobacter cryoconitis TaxID=188932 RepID=A0A327S7R4_9SPHI|nr:hypothetical protein [Pedobacter cryoconitis]RAJ25006.1 hypothetical protein LY11_04193 [Pedobacter cryoconitis]
MSYGIKYKCEFTSTLNKNIKVYILKKDYNSAQIELRMGGEPARINYTGGSESKFDIIRGSECILEFYSEYDGQFQEIMLADAQDYQVQIWKSDQMIWQGYVIQDNYSEPFLAAPYLVSIRATDGLGNLKHNDFMADDTSFYLDKMTCIEVIQKCLAKLKNGTQVITSVDLFETRISRSEANNEALNCISVNPYLFIKDDLNALKCNVALSYILEVFNAYIYYKAGKYYIERLSYKLNDIITRRVYNINFDGSISAVVKSYTENISRIISRDSGLRLINADHNITYQTPFNKVQIDSDVVNSNNIVVNSFFRNWNNSIGIPFNWVKSGIFAISKLTYITTGDAIRVTQKATDAQLNYTTNKLTAGNVNFSGYKTTAKLSIKFASNGNARFMVKASTATKSYYLYCTSSVQTGDITDPNFEFKYTGSWKDYATHCTIERGTDSRSEIDAWYVSNITDMNLPADIKSLEFSLLPAFDTSKFTGGYRVRQFTPIITTSEASDYYGQRYNISSSKVNRETFTDLKPALGEFGNVSLVNQTRLNDDFTLNWYRDGKTETRPLLELVGQTILNQYRCPFRQFSGSLYGEFDFSMVYKINGLDGRYIPFKAGISLKSDTIDVEFFELLNDTDEVSDKIGKVTNYKDSNYTTNPDPTSEYRPQPSRSGGGRN